MNRIKNIFNSVDRGYLIKSYIISFFITSIAVAGGSMDLRFGIILGILFPFSCLVWDEFFNLMAGNTFFVLPLPIMLMLKIVKIAFLYVAAIVLAPLGILYIVIRNRGNLSN